MDLMETTLGRTGLRVSRMGLAGGYLSQEKVVARAFDQGVNYFYWDPRWGAMTQGLRSVMPGKRDQMVIAAGSSLRTAPGVRHDLESSLKSLGTDYLDVFHIHYLKSQDEAAKIFGRSGALEELTKAKREGFIRAVAVSTHDRSLARQLAETGAIDVLMIRYNCAHRGAEREVFPTARQQGCGVVIYSALRWGSLLRAPANWPSGRPVPTPAQCYRFVLECPDVHVVLTAPRNEAQLEENLKAAQLGPGLSPEDMEWLREFGDVVHG